MKNLGKAILIIVAMSIFAGFALFAQTTLRLKQVTGTPSSPPTGFTDLRIDNTGTAKLLQSNGTDSAIALTSNTVGTSRSITGNNGLTGGGDLSTDRTISLPTFGSSDGAYWLIPYGLTNGLASGSLTTSGTIYALRFYLPMRLTFTRMVFYVVTAGSTTVNASAAIYDSARTTRLAYSNPVSIVTNGVKSVTIDSTTLNPGYYWLDTVEEHNVINTSFLCASFSTVNAPFMNSQTIQVGSAGTAASGAILPTTPNSVTDLGATTVNVIGVKLTN